MSDTDLYKAIKEYSENNDLDNVREANKILRKIKDTCKSQTRCVLCPYYRIIRRKQAIACILNDSIPENWEI